MLLIEEKTKNKKANTPTSFNRKNNARATQGRKILEKKLADCIEYEHGKGKVISSIKEMPFKINWDYCRVVTGEIMMMEL